MINQRWELCDVTEEGQPLEESDAINRRPYVESDAINRRNPMRRVMRVTPYRIPYNEGSDIINRREPNLSR